MGTFLVEPHRQGIPHRFLGELQSKGNLCNLCHWRAESERKGMARLRGRARATMVDAGLVFEHSGTQGPSEGLRAISCYKSLQMELGFLVCSEYRGTLSLSGLMF